MSDDLCKRCGRILTWNFLGVLECRPCKATDRPQIDAIVRDGVRFPTRAASTVLEADEDVIHARRER